MADVPAESVIDIINNKQLKLLKLTCYVDNIKDSDFE